MKGFVLHLLNNTEHITRERPEASLQTSLTEFRKGRGHLTDETNPEALSTANTQCQALSMLFAKFIVNISFKVAFNLFAVFGK